MTTNKFEDTYSSVNVAKDHIKDLPIICELLRNAPAPMSCKEIGFAMFGDAYTYNDNPASHDEWVQRQRRHCLTAHLTQMLRHLVRGGFAVAIEVEDAPIEIEVEEYVRRDGDGNTGYIKVWDKDGHEYEIPNPRYNPRFSTAKWEKVKKTITPHHKAYQWVAD